MKLLPGILVSILPTVYSNKREYTGISFSDYGVFDFTIETAETATALREINEKYVIDWFRPHRGASFELGQHVQIIAEPNDRKGHRNSVKHEILICKIIFIKIFYHKSTFGLKMKIFRYIESASKAQNDI